MSVSSSARTTQFGLLILVLVTPLTAGAVSKQASESVVLVLTIDKARYAPNELMKIGVTVRNRTRATVTYEFPTSQMFDVKASKGTKVLWTWSRGMAFTQAFTTLSLKPGEARSFNVTWNLRDDEGKLLQPGAYSLLVVFPPAVKTPGMPPLQLRMAFEITARS